MPNKNFLLVKKEKGNPMVYSMIPEHKMGLLAETSLTGHWFLAEYEKQRFLFSPNMCNIFFFWPEIWSQVL